MANEAEEARGKLLLDTVRTARECAERGEWQKAKRLINLALEIAKDLPKKQTIEPGKVV